DEEMGGDTDGDNAPVVHRHPLADQDALAVADGSGEHDDRSIRLTESPLDEFTARDRCDALPERAHLRCADGLLHRSSPSSATSCWSTCALALGPVSGVPKRGNRGLELPRRNSNTIALEGSDSRRGGIGSDGKWRSSRKGTIQ